MNKYYTNIAKQISFKKSPQLNNLEDIINYYNNHISSKGISSSNRAQWERFTFNYISSDEIKNDNNILKDVIDTYLPILTKIINSSVTQNEFRNNLKLADVFPGFKKKKILF